MNAIVLFSAQSARDEEIDYRQKMTVEFEREKKVIEFLFFYLWHVTILL